MNNLVVLLHKGERVLRQNSPVILTALGVSGVVSTAYLTGVATYRASHRLEDQSPYMDKREVIERCWDLYIPPAISGVVAIGCIIASNRVSSKRMAAAYSLAAVSEQVLSEYREKVIETIGEKKEQKIRDDISQDRVNANPPGVIVMGRGDVVCCEMLTGRYFMSDMETLRKAQNDINSKLLSQDYATLNDLYYMLGLQYTSDSGKTGWTSDKQMDLSFSTVLTEDQRPCLAFEYNYTKIL